MTLTATAFVDTRIVNMTTTPCEVPIDRSGPFGNPFPLRSESDRAAVLEKYRAYFHKRVESDPEFRRRVLALRGRVLGCWCSPKLCHGTIIVEWLETHLT